MSKYLLSKTKQDFTRWFAGQNDSLKYDLMTTDFHARTELAVFRRLYIKLLNHRNHKELQA